MFNLQPWLEEAFEAEERVQQGLEEDKNIWSKENGKYLLMIKLTKKMYTFHFQNRRRGSYNRSILRKIV